MSREAGGRRSRSPAYQHSQIKCGPVLEVSFLLSLHSKSQYKFQNPTFKESLTPPTPSNHPTTSRPYLHHHAAKIQIPFVPMNKKKHTSGSLGLSSHKIPSIIPSSLSLQPFYIGFSNLKIFMGHPSLKKIPSQMKTLTWDRPLRLKPALVQDTDYI